MIAPLVKRLPIIPGTVLMIGNSFMYFNNGVDSYAAAICRDMGFHIGFTMITISGGGLNWHPLECYLRQKGMRSYTPSREGDGLNFHDYPDSRIFDAVIMQDNSQGPIHPRLAPLFQDTVREKCSVIKAEQSIPLLLITWAYTGRPEMTEELASAIIKTANENGAMVIPAGLAFAEAASRRPDLKLIGEDRHHPLPCGTYLEACAICAALTGQSPQGAPFRGLGASRVTSEEADFLQGIAWEVAREFFGWQ